MYCRHCGASMRDDATICGTCGAPAGPPPQRFAIGGEGPAVAYEGGGPFTGGRVDWTLQDVLFALLWFLGLLIVVPLVIALPFAVATPDTEAPGPIAASLVGSAFADIGFIAVAAWFSFRKYGGSWERLGFAWPTWRAGGWALAALVAAFALSAAYGGIIELFDVEQLTSKCDDQIPDVVLENAALMALAGVIVIGFAPICEETLFRGFIFPGMARGWSVLAGITASAAVFAAAHIGPAWHKTFIPIFIIGAVFAATYYKSGNIFSTVAAHLVFNSIAFAGLTQCDPDDAAILGWARDVLAGAMAR
jgi:membrane protease YdiL (CAAX protease family)